MKALLLLLPAFLAGCAAQPPAPEPKTGKVECHREKPTGLVRSVVVCRDVAATSQRDKESKEFIENMRQPPASEQTLGR